MKQNKKTKKLFWKIIIPVIIIFSFASGAFIPSYIKNYKEKIKKEALNPETLTQKVMPKEGVSLGISFADTVIKMVELGAIDKQKFDELYKNRGGPASLQGGLPKEIAALFDGTSNQPITINQDNANILLNILWPLGLANKTQIMKESPMGKDYAKDIENFASTGGWSLGKVTGGKLFNSLPLITLTSEQEQIVKELAENIYRPCCGNSTFFPDCNHGAAMLGFLYLAASQGMSKEEMYQKALAINSYWFPQTYVELATYYQAKKNISWEKVAAKEVLGSNYSSGTGYQAISKQLQAEGILPKVSGGGGCGV